MNLDAAVNPERFAGPVEPRPLDAPRPPFLWPEAKCLAGMAVYPEIPPFASFVENAELLSGVLVDAVDGTILWLRGLLLQHPTRRIRLVIVLSEACPTREEHLRAMLMLREAHTSSEGTPLDVRLLAMSRVYGKGCRHSVLPPTILQAHDSKTGETLTCIGSVGDAGHGPVLPGSLNLVFRSDPGLRDSWRKWFQYLYCAASPLNDETCRIPYLVPPEGSQEAAMAWAEFLAACEQSEGGTTPPTIDPATGEVTTDGDGNPIDPWDNGDTAIEALAGIFHKIYEEGFLVTVDEGTRIKPFKIPVKAALLGQQSQRSVGNLTQRQAFSLSVLDALDEKELEKCRKITDAMELLSLPLSKGNRFIPRKAKEFLELEIEARNTRAKAALKAALGGDNVEAFIGKRLTSIKKDLNQMYKELGQGDEVPGDKLKTVIDDIRTRLTNALNERITPSVVYNRITAPSIGPNDPAENWSQPLSILHHAAALIRKSLTDPFFPRNFSKLSFTEQDCLGANNLFGDHLLKSADRRKAGEEQLQVADVLEADIPPRIKCERLWSLVTKGEAPPMPKPE